MDKALFIVGRTLLGSGVLVFLFIGYQLWGTSLAEARDQDRLQAEAQQLFQQAPPTTATPPSTAPPAPGETLPPTTAAPVPTTMPVPQGSAVAVIRIPKIDVTKAVVAGTSVNDLKKGPGHYTGTPLPGQSGNAAIAGHRTTYGAPFGRLGELRAGDEIDVTTRQGTFVYKVTSTQIVSPNQNSVLAPTNDDRLTLTTCHPRYSAAQRLIVVAHLAEGEKPAPPPAGTAPSTLPPTTEATPNATALVAPPTTVPLDVRLDGADLSGKDVSKYPAILWGFLLLLVAGCIYTLAEAFHRLPAYLFGSPVFLITLFIFFENLNRLLPANA